MRVQGGEEGEEGVGDHLYLPMVSFSTSISRGSCESRVARELKKELAGRLSIDWDTTYKR